MSPSLRFLLTILALVCGMPPGETRCAPALERGAAITDPLALRELDRGSFGLSRMLVPARPVDMPLANDQLFALPSMAPVRRSLDEEFERYVGKHRAELRNETIGVGPSFDVQLFDRALLYSPDTRFVLAGIVNRMDRAFVSAAGCGEIRLIYRLTRTDVPAAADDHAVSPRLPMTLNLVLKAKNDPAADRKGAAPGCAGIARRWLAAGDWPLTGAALAEKLTSGDGPLDLIGPENIDRIETNLQIAHAPKSRVREFRTDYLLKVFDYNAQTKSFDEATLENQIDRERILADEKLRRDLRAWLLEPAHVAELDRGTILIPRAFLATRAIAPTPTGFSSSSLQPAFGLVEGEGADPVFTASDIVAALNKAAERGDSLQNIRSVAGFARRLGDITCAGLPSNPRHRRLSFSRRRLDGGASVQRGRWCRPRRISSATRSVAAIFWCRYGRIRHPIIHGDFPAGRNCAAAANWPGPNMRTAGARIATARLRGLRTVTAVSNPGPAPAGSPVRS